MMIYSFQTLKLQGNRFLYNKERCFTSKKIELAMGSLTSDSQLLQGEVGKNHHAMGAVMFTPLSSAKFEATKKSFKKMNENVQLSSSKLR